MEIVDGLKIKFNGMKWCDDVFDSMIVMFELMLNSEELLFVMDARLCGSSLKFGFRVESYVFLYFIDVLVEGVVFKMVGIFVIMIIFGEMSNMVYLKLLVLIGFGGICANIG